MMDINKRVDLVITLGGDGTMLWVDYLFSSHSFVKLEIYVWFLLPLIFKVHTGIVTFSLTQHVHFYYGFFTTVLVLNDCSNVHQSSNHVSGCFSVV